MLFNSHEFILIFLPIALLIYFISGRKVHSRLGTIILISTSLIFAALADISSVMVLISSTVINYYIARKLQKRTDKKGILWIGVAFNVLMLCFFKYFNTVSEYLQGMEALQIMLPIGISFYTFQQIAYLVDVHRGEVAVCSFSDYFLFNAFFPKLVQGPIPYAKELIPQFSDSFREKANYENLSCGLYLFAIGLSKKVLLADQFGKITDYGFGSISSLNRFEAIITILSYTIQLYLDFSGYCDMACGVAKMFNIDLPQNFNSPYKAKNISDFWKRWHITLTRFLTKYIYIPLGGNRKGTGRTYLNIMIVYLVSGLWHGTGVPFLIWGLLHGAATVLYRISKKQYDKMPGAVQWILTFLFINVTWVFFRAASVADAIELLKTVFTGAGGYAINAELTETLLQPALISVASRLLTLPVVVVIACVTSIGSLLLLKNSSEKAEQFHSTLWQGFQTYILLMLGILSVSGVSTFLYVNF